MSYEQFLYVIGYPVSHSKSPDMYNALYQSLGLPWSYAIKEIPTPDEAEDFVRNGDYLSINITTPYKPLALACADEKSATCIALGGANVLIRQGEGPDKKLVAHNTDGLGCVSYLKREGAHFEGSDVVVCGTGPTALSILFALTQAQVASATLLGRDEARANSVLAGFCERVGKQDCKLQAGSYETSRDNLVRASIIIDATTLGMKADDPAPFDTSLLNPSQWVMDVVYGHGETALVKGALEHECTVFDGRGMLVGQAVETAYLVAQAAEVTLQAPYDELFDVMASAAFGSGTMELS